MTDWSFLDGPITAAEVRSRRAIKQRSPAATGYFMPPGTGPAGETCGSCKNCVGQQFSKTYYKCKLAEKIWTHSRRTDILKRSDACAKWEKAE